MILKKANINLVLGFSVFFLCVCDSQHLKLN